MNLRESPTTQLRPGPSGQPIKQMNLRESPTTQLRPGPSGQPIKQMNLRESPTTQLRPGPAGQPIKQMNLRESPTTQLRPGPSGQPIKQMNLRESPTTQLRPGPAGQPIKQMNLRESPTTQLRPGPAAWLKFDENGMVLPHSFLGSSEDFRKYLEDRGEKELAEKIPKSPENSFDQLFETTRSKTNNVESETSSHHRNIQSNALQHWDKHVQYHRKQQNKLSYLLDKPVESLQMNQASRFRETQEQKEHLNRVMPLTHSGYGYRVGSEFWSLPQRYGDEMSGITATLTQTERGQNKPVTHAGKPSGIQKELGLISIEPQRQSAYPQHQCQELKDLLQKIDIKKPDISKLEIAGSGKAFTSTTVDLLLEKEEEKKEHEEIMKKHLNPQAEQDDVRLKALSVPALRIQGKLATWTGNSTARTGEVGISTSFFFEALTGEILSSDVELYNEGNTAIFYSWQKQIVPPSSFEHLIKRKPRVPFYFKFSPGVVLPGETKRVECLYKAVNPGYQTQLWQLNTHPLLMEGASIDVRFTGVAFSPDKNKEKRLFLEQQLEKKVTVSMCQSLVDEILDRVQSPERPSSPAELYITEEQQFKSKNSKFQYRYQPVEDLKTLWHKVNPGGIWDFSIDTLDQAVMSYEESPSASLTKEEGLAELNSLCLQLSEPSYNINKFPLTATFMEQLLRNIMQEKISNEAIRLRKVFDLPEMEMCADGKEKTEISDAAADGTHKDDKLQNRAVAAAKEEKKGMKSKLKGDIKRQSKTPLSVSSAKEMKGKSKDDAGRSSSVLHMKESASVTKMSSKAITPQLPDDQRVDSEMMRRYSNALKKKVYALEREMKDNLAAMMKDIKVEDGQKTD